MLQRATCATAVEPRSGARARCCAAGHDASQTVLDRMFPLSVQPPLANRWKVCHALILVASLVVPVASPASAQIPADVSMGFAVSESGCCAVVAEVTEQLTDGLAIVGGAYWGAEDSQYSRRPRSPGSTIGFYVAPRLYTEPPGRLRPFGEVAVGSSLSSVRAHAITFRPSLGIEAVVGCRTRLRTSAGYGLALGLGKDVGFTIMTALVLIPASGGR